MSHTPGPWTIEPRTSNGRREIVYQHATGELGGRIALVVGAGTDHGDANARLIAAAPELLEALKRARRYVVDSCSQNLDDPDVSDRLALDALDAAIAKASTAGSAGGGKEKPPAGDQREPV